MYKVVQSREGPGGDSVIDISTIGIQVLPMHESHHPIYGSLFN